MYDLINIFGVFLPQLLLYPNPTDPLNGEAASLLLKDPEKYKDKVKEYVKKYAIVEEDIKEEEIDLPSNTEQSQLSNASLDDEESN